MTEAGVPTSRNMVPTINNRQGAEGYQGDSHTNSHKKCPDVTQTLEGADSPAAYPKNGSGEDSSGAVGPMLEGFRDLLWTEEVTGEPPRGPGYVLWPIGGAQEQEEPALSRPLEAFGAIGANQSSAGFTSQEEVPDRGLEGAQKPREVPGGY